MEIDINKLLTFLFSTLAIGISIVTIIITRRNLRKQLRLSKLEELLEIIHYLNGYYVSLLRIFLGFEEGVEALQNRDDDTIPPSIIETARYRKKFVETMTKESITNKISRLKVLSNAYLTNSRRRSDLKIRIHTIADLYYNMYMFIFMEGDSNLIQKTKDAIIPSPDSMEKYITKIEDDIMNEMNLGYKNINSISKTKYYKTQFKKDLET